LYQQLASRDTEEKRGTNILIPDSTADANKGVYQADEVRKQETLARTAIIIVY